MKVIADYVAVLGAVSGSTVISLNIGINEVGFVLFLLSSIATIYLLHISDASKSVHFITFYFLIANIIGIIRA